MAPLRDAVRFVDDEQRDLGMPLGSVATKSAFASRSGVTKSSDRRLRGDVGQRVAAARRADSALLRTAAAMPRAVELVGLVLHQRDERRDDDRHAGECSAGNW